MALTSYLGDPFSGQLERAMDRAFDRALGGRTSDVVSMFMPSMLGPSGLLRGHPMDIVETKDAFELHVDAPGFTPEDIAVQMNEGVLTISGCKSMERPEEGKVVRRERQLTTFTRSFTLPNNAKHEGITAHLDKGVLRVSVPKAEPTPKPEPKRIQVMGGAPQVTGA